MFQDLDPADIQRLALDSVRGRQGEIPDSQRPLAVFSPQLSAFQNLEPLHLPERFHLAAGIARLMLPTAKEYQRSRPITTSSSSL
jgi:hypothetical protein